MAPSPLDSDEGLKRLLALIATLWAMALTTGILVAHVILTMKNISWSPPPFVERISEGVIFSAVVVLGTATTGAIRAILKQKDGSQ